MEATGRPRNLSMLIVRCLPAALAICLALVVLLAGTRTDIRRDERRAGRAEVLHESSVTEVATDSYAHIRKTYVYTLPEADVQGARIAAYLVHQYAEVWIGDALAFRSSGPEQPRLGKTPGNYWIFVPLRAEDAGAELRLVLTPVYESTVEHKPLVSVSSELEVLDELIRGEWPELLLGFACLLNGIAFATYSLFFSLGFEQRMHVFYLGAFTAVFGLGWLCSLPLTPLLLGVDARSLYYLSMSGLMLTPVLFTRFLAYKEDSGNRRAYRFLNGVTTLVALALTVLQLLNLRDLRESLPVVLLGNVAMLICVALLSIRILIRLRGWHPDVIYGTFSLLYAVAAVADGLRFVHGGVLGSVSILLCMVALSAFVFSIYAVHRSIKWRIQLNRAETELGEARISAMLSQIQPHFLYNTLDSICYLCGKDPPRAQKALRDFSHYLRGNLTSIDRKEPVLFADELRHVETYLALVKMSMEDKLRYEFDCPVTEFRIPALTVQPLVENAVRHGLQETLEGGTVTVSTGETADAYVVTVHDDGPGFDPALPPGDGKVHIGLENVRKRLCSVCGGTLAIESAPGAGTSAVISIPKEEGSLW